jgi:hypothetical protein
LFCDWIICLTSVLYHGYGGLKIAPVSKCPIWVLDGGPVLRYNESWNWVLERHNNLIGFLSLRLVLAQPDSSFSPFKRDFCGVANYKNPTFFFSLFEKKGAEAI